MSSLPPPADEALDVLEDAMSGTAGFSKGAAVRALEDATFAPSQAERLVEYLHDAGYLYRVDETYYLTPRRSDDGD
jgi:DNA-binding IclR family transcriptional regulator